MNHNVATAKYAGRVLYVPETDAEAKVTRGAHIVVDSTSVERYRPPKCRRDLD
jgi:hypothetical protein